MEDSFPHTLRPLWIHDHALRPHQCTRSLSASDEWYLPGLHGRICRGLFGWHFNLFQGLGNPRQTCTIGACDTPRAWFIRQVGKMWIRQIFSGVPRLRDLSIWHFHGQVKGRDHPVLGYSILGQGRSMLPGVCQLLSSVYQRLLQDRSTVNNPDLQRQALLVEPNGPGCFWYSQDGIHLCTHPDTSRSCQAIHCGNGCFKFCLGSYSISIWNRWVVASSCFLFTEVNQCRNQLPGLR